MNGAHHIPIAARWVPARFFYGWVIAAGCLVFSFVGVGIGYYGLALFLRPLRAEHGWSNGWVSGATCLYFVVSGITAFLIGPTVDRVGPKRFMFVGACLMSASVVAVGAVHSLWQLYLVYTLLAVGYGCSTAVAVSSLITRWFVNDRAKATSIASTGTSLGGLVLVPVGTRLLNHGGLQTVTIVFGILLLAVALPVVLLVIARDPSDLGLLPDGGKAATRVSRVTAASQTRVWSRAEAARTMPFWAVTVAFVMILAAQTGYLLHQINYLEGKYGSRNQAAFAVSVAAFGSIVARLFVGRFVDPLDKRKVAAVLCLIQGGAILGIVSTNSVPLVFLLTLVFGFTIGNVYMMQQLLVAEIFGIPSFGAVYGLVALAGQTASGVGPLAVGWLDDRYDSYSVPFTAAGLLILAGSVIVLAARPIPAPVAAVDPLAATRSAPAAR